MSTQRHAGRIAGKKIKVDDVARAAGVSASTVDRVLNGREGVKLTTMRRVEEAMVKLGYAANSLAARLASPAMQLQIVVPRGVNPFYESLVNEFLEQSKPMSEAGSEVAIHRIDIFDPEEVQALMRSFRPCPGMTVILVAHNASEIGLEIDSLVQSGVPVITLVSDNVRSARRSFIGIDNFAAGRTAGELMSRFIGERNGVVGILVGHAGLRDHLDRRSGFEQIMAELRPNCEVRLIGSSQEESAQALLLTRRAFDNDPDLIGLYNTGAANDGVFAALEPLAARPRPVVIAHELTEVTRRALIKGTCAAVITQDVPELARRSIDAAIAAHGKAANTERSGGLQIGITIRENLPW